MLAKEGIKFTKSGRVEKAYIKEFKAPIKLKKSELATEKLATPQKDAIAFHEFGLVSPPTPAMRK